VRIQAFIGLVLLAACTPAVAGQTPAANELQPYLTVTPSATQTVPAQAGGSAGTPLPSPTPFTYTVSAGDTLSQIAQKFSVSLDALLTANPNVDPNAMAVGAVLKIPSNPQHPGGEASPTPVPIDIEQAACHPTSDRALWCFVLLHNDSGATIEDVTASVTLLDANGQSITSQTGTLPLNIVQQGRSLPLAVFFAPDVRMDARPQVQILTAIGLLPGDQRYLPAAIGNTLVSVDWSGLTAQVAGQVTLPPDSKPAGVVWVAAVAYDAAGQVIGLRRWESNAGLSPGGSLPFSFMISSVAGKIARADFAVEARPQ
jgi:LysM repeat protein